MGEEKRGAFVALEGIDGSGKGTQIKKLKKRLEAEGYAVYRTAEPNDSPTGDLILLTDRYYFSSYAYQSVDVPMDWVIEANSLAAKLLRPDLTIFIDVDPHVTMERIEKNRLTRELFEETDRLMATRARYLEAFERMKDVEKILIVDGNRSVEVIHEEIWKKTKSLYVK